MYILEIFYFCLMPTRLSKYIISFQTDIPWIKSMSTYNIFLHNYSSTSLNFDQDISPMVIERSVSAPPTEDDSDKMYRLEWPSIEESNSCKR